MKTSLCNIRNKILLNLESLKLTQKEKAALIGVSQQTVSHIIRKSKEEAVPLKKAGPKQRLSEDQLTMLPKILSKGALFYNYEGDFWTQKRVRDVIESEFGVIYEVRQVGRILKKIGWSRQKPQKKITDNL